jgi:hypothetical protein
MGKISNLAGCRNDIAHGLVSSFSTRKDKEPEKLWGHFLIPPQSNTKKRLSPERTLKLYAEHGLEGPPQYHHRYAYVADQVLTYAAAFDDYRVRIRDLVIRVQADLSARWPPQALRELEYEQQIRALQTKVSELESQLQPQSSPESPEDEAQKPPKM